MQLDDMILVSVDDHISEPPGMFDGLAPAKYRDRMPRVERRGAADVWCFEGQEVQNIGLNAAVGSRPEDFGLQPLSFDRMRPGVFDVDARIDDMNVNGVLGSLNFPTFPGLAGTLFLEVEDKDLCLDVLRAYNDWHIDAWCGAHPGRFIPLALLPLWDPTLAAREVRRVKRKGCSAVSFHPNPARLGLPSLQSDHWDPLWAACADEAVTLCLHIGDRAAAAPSPDSPIDAYITNMPMTLFGCASELVWSQILRKHREIRFALSEGGVGWVPYFLERIDRVHRTHRAWTHQDFGGRPPSQVFLEHVYTCFIEDRHGVLMRHAAGLDNMTWECDYPHSDTTWPRSPEVLWESLKDVPDEEIHKITHRTAMRAFHYDPFALLDPEACTVGALRARAAHVDTGDRSPAASVDDGPRDPLRIGDVQLPGVPVD